MYGRYPRYVVCGHGLPTIKRSSAGEERLPNLRDEHAVVTRRAHVSMQVQGRARNLHVLVRLRIGDIGLAIEPQCPVTTYSVSVAVFGCPMPRASIHTNLASQADVDVEGVMEPIGTEAHVNKAVLHSDVCLGKCNCRTKWNCRVKINFGSRGVPDEVR